MTYETALQVNEGTKQKFEEQRTRNSRFIYERVIYCLQFNGNKMYKPKYGHPKRI